jgi:short-subunit dehydrogenase
VRLIRSVKPRALLRRCLGKIQMFRRPSMWPLGAIPGLPNMAHESAFKSYVLNLGEALHHELAASGVKGTVMLPGNVDTPIIDRFGLDRARLPISPIPAGKAVDQTVRALLAGRATIIPDRRMPAVARLTPRGASIRLNGRMLGEAAAKLANTRTAPSSTC